MTAHRLMRELYKWYLEFFLATTPGLLGPPLNYHRFMQAICLLVTGNSDNQEGVWERYKTFEAYCLKHSQKADPFVFIARSIVSNPRAGSVEDRQHLAHLVDACEAIDGRLSLVMN